MRNIAVIFLFIANLSACSLGQKEFNAESAWQEFSQVFTQDYAYLNTTGVDVDKLLAQYKEKALVTKNESEFVDVIQIFLRYFHDPHLAMGPVDENDYSVTPTGSDIWSVYQEGKYLVEDIKAGSAAYKSGLQVGDVIISVDGLVVDEAINKVFGGDLANLSIKQKIWGLNIALGGLRSKARSLTVLQGSNKKTLKLAATYEAENLNLEQELPTLSFKRIKKVGYIRFNNSLGNSDTVDAFTEAVENLLDTEALIIDLRNIPSGGNTGVAEPILGHFVKQKTAYQLYQLQEDGVMFQDAEMQQAFAKPNAPFYSKPFVVLVGRWTGSIGEGMMIGFDTLGAKAIIGAPVADLLGGIKSMDLDESASVLYLGFERLFHVNGTYREDFEANIKVNSADWGVNGTDPALTKALDLLNESNDN